jgi:hypothetical protein
VAAKHSDGSVLGDLEHHQLLVKAPNKPLDAFSFLLFSAFNLTLPLLFDLLNALLTVCPLSRAPAASEFYSFQTLFSVSRTRAY